MAETLKIVTFDIGGRAQALLDLNDGTFQTVARDSFTPAPPAKTRQMSAAERRYGGSRQTGETTDNGTCSWVTMVAAGSQDEATAKLEALFSQVEAIPAPLFLEWVPDGNTEVSFYDIRGTADWDPGEWKAQPWVQNGLLVVKLSIPVAPLARGHQMDILDVFAIDTRGDYSYDAGASGNEEVAGGALKCAANPNTEQIARHTARGYKYASNQQTWKYIPKATITGWKGGGAVKAIDANNRVEVYVEDNGTNSILKVDLVSGGERKNKTSSNLGTRVANGVAYWVRGRIENNLVTAEYFTAQPGPMTAPTTTNSYTLTAGAERTTFGEGVKGYAARIWIPKTVGAELDEYAVEPWTYRNQTLPAKIALDGVIPGDAPALVDIAITPSGGAAAPIWALVALAKKPAAGLAQAPFGIIEAETAGNVSGWVSTANANYRGGKGLVDTAAASTDVYTASWEIDPSLLAADPFQQEAAVEVWARVALDATVVTPTLTVSARPQDGTNYGSARYTDEWGSGGKLLTTPSTGTEKFRPVKLGTLRLLVDTTRPRVWLLYLEGAVGAGSSGAWGIDYLILVPTQFRASSPSSKANDSGFPKFVPSTNETAKIIHSDLSATIAKPPSYGHPDHGLGGNLLEPTPGELEVVVKLSSLAADDPTSDATTEQLSHAATVQFSHIIPRWQLLRSGS